jgi:hypothetical protein
MEKGLTIEQAIEALEGIKTIKKTGRLKEKQIIKNYETR